MQSSSWLTLRNVHHGNHEVSCYSSSLFGPIIVILRISFGVYGAHLPYQASHRSLLVQNAACNRVFPLSVSVTFYHDRSGFALRGILSFPYYSSI